MVLPAIGAAMTGIQLAKDTGLLDKLSGKKSKKKEKKETAQPQQQPAVKADSYSQVQAPAEDKCKVGKASDTKKKDRSQFTQSTQTTTQASQTTKQVSQTKQSGSSQAVPPAQAQDPAHQVRDCCKHASQKLEKAGGGFESSASQSLDKADFKGLQDAAAKFGELIHGIRDQLLGDLKQAAGGGQGPGGASGAKKGANAGQGASPSQAAGAAGANGASGAGAASEAQGKGGPEGAGAASEAQGKGGPEGAGDIQSQIQQLVKMLEELLKGLQGQMGQKGCPAKEQDVAFQNVAKGAGAQAPRGSYAQTCIEAISRSFSASSLSVFKA